MSDKDVGARSKLELLLLHKVELGMLPFLGIKGGKEVFDGRSEAETLTINRKTLKKETTNTILLK